MVAIYQLGNLEPSETYFNVLIFFPQLFAICVIAGSFLLCMGASCQQSSMQLWRIYAGLIALHSVLLLVYMVLHADEFSGAPNVNDYVFLVTWMGYSVGLLVVVFVTLKRARTWFNAAMWMQIVLSLSALVCASFVVPTAALAISFLIGGKLNVIASASLLFVSVIQRMDGARALDRKTDESPIQLNLKMMFILMTIGGILFAWVCSFCFVKLPDQQPALDQAKTVLLDRPGTS